MKNKNKKKKLKKFVRPEQIWRPVSRSKSCEASTSGCKKSDPPTPASWGSWLNIPIIDDLGRPKTNKAWVPLRN